MVYSIRNRQGRADKVDLEEDLIHDSQEDLKRGLERIKTTSCFRDTFAFFRGIWSRELYGSASAYSETTYYLDYKDNHEVYESNCNKDEIMELLLDLKALAPGIITEVKDFKGKHSRTSLKDHTKNGGVIGVKFSLPKVDADNCWEEDVEVYQRPSKVYCLVMSIVRSFQEGNYGRATWNALRAHRDLYISINEDASKNKEFISVLDWWMYFQRGWFISSRLHAPKEDEVLRQIDFKAIKTNSRGINICWNDMPKMADEKIRKMEAAICEMEGFKQSTQIDNELVIGSRVWAQENEEEED